ncbi:MAG: TetR/AcrR family transcriptional regulator [Ferrimicrobium sp.]
MIDGKTVETSRVGRPRSEKTRLAILEAAADLLVEGGFNTTTIESIAARARVSKVTIYKWWPSRGSVAIDAYFHRFRQTLTFPDTGTVAEDLLAQMSVLISAFRGRAGEIMAELIGQAQSDAELANTIRTGWMQPRREVTALVIQRAIDRGELRPDLGIPILMDELYGPIYYRLITRYEPLSDEFVQELVRNTLEGVLSTRPSMK